MIAVLPIVLVIGLIYEKYNDNIKINDYVKVGFFVLLIRFAAVLAVCFATKRSYVEAFNIWDGPHYIDIAENGYVKSGSGAEFIVFYPLYPFLIRALAFIFGSSTVSALVISNTCAVAGGIYFYKLCRIDMNEEDGIFALMLMYTFPFSFFMSGVYTESLFIMLVSMTMYYTLKGKYLPAAAAAFLAALTRVQGVLLAVFMLAEIFKANRKKCAYALCPAGGFGIYLLINKAVFGNAFEFMKYQKEVWYQQPSWIGDNIAKFANYVFEGSELSYQIMLPQLVLFVLACTVIYLAVKRGMRTGFGIYAAAYIFTVYSASWLLSGGRYTAGLTVLYQAAATAVKNKSVRRGIIIFNTLLMIVYAVLYANFKQIM